MELRNNPPKLPLRTFISSLNAHKVEDLKWEKVKSFLIKEYGKRKEKQTEKQTESPGQIDALFSMMHRRVVIVIHLVEGIRFVEVEGITTMQETIREYQINLIRCKEQNVSRRRASSKWK